MRIPLLGEVTIGRREPTVQEQLVSKLTAQMADKLLETVDLMANYVDPWERFNGPNGERWLPIGSSGAGDEGRSPTDYSHITNEEELTYVRDYCRLLAFTNPFAINLHENMVNYIIGDGVKPTIVAQKGQELSDDAIKQIQEVLDEWMYENDWVAIQQESVRRFDRDGEYFRRFFMGTDGDIAVRFVEPNFVTRPAGNNNPESLFGVETDPDDVETIKGYWIDKELVKAEEIQHVKANVDRNVRRGIPTTWPIGSLLKKAVDVLDNIAVTSQIQTAIALIRRHVNGTSAGAQSMRASAASWTQTDSKTGITDYYQRRKKGQIIDASMNTEYDFPAAGLDVEKYGMGVQAILRACASRVCFPEFMFTSDASNANYSSTMVAEGPAVRMFQRRQRMQEDADLKVLWRVLEAKAEAGAIPGKLLEKIEIQCEPPRVQVRDEKADAETTKLLIELGLMSKQTASAKFDLEYQQEQENIEQHNEAHPDEMQQAELGLMQAKAAIEPLTADKQARMEALEAYYGGASG